MNFWKMNGAGNDFIIIDNIEEKLDDSLFPILAKKLCQRRFSIGADGLMIVEKPNGEGDYRMVFFNSDGSEGEMCGNGARCICRYGYEKGIVGIKQIVETKAGLVYGERLDERNYKIRLNEPTKIEMDKKIRVENLDLTVHYVELGSPPIPHAVVMLEDFDLMEEDELRKIAKQIRFHESFEKGANVNFIKRIGEDLFLEKTFERGVEDFTFACGTGTGSSVVALTELGLTKGSHVKVKMAGGTLVIDYERDDNASDLYLTGPTNIVAKGCVFDEELEL